ncbi:MAG: hypothetical protein R3B41_01840 [Candidatus Doudnabacteria bacterium]
MKNKHKIFSAIVAILFVVVVQWFVSPVPVFRFLIPVFLLYLSGVMLYTWNYLIKKDDFSFWVWLRLPMFLGTWFWLLFLVPSGLAKGLFLLLSVALIFFFTNNVGKNGQQLAWNQYLITLFGVIIGISGFSFYFEEVNGLIFLIGLFGLVLLGTRTAVQQIPHPNSVKWLVSLVMALFAVELQWIMLFLPLHYTVLSVFIFNILYLLWAIYYHYLYQTLNQKQIQFNFLMILLLSILILLTTPWSIQS